MTANTRLGLAGILGMCVPLLIGAVVGCESNKKAAIEPVQDEAAPTEAQKRLSGVLRDTVGGVAYLQGTRWQAVRGYGLVVGLGKNGSRTCPEPLREQMLQEIRKRLETDGIYSLDQIQVKANDLMDSLDTAVVEVTGLIPPGACKGARFDVHVQAVAGTETRTLEGGRLYTCNLHMYRMGSQGDLIHGKVLAHAAGAIFQPIVQTVPEAPASQAAASQPDLRRGLVLGGGRNLATRPMELALGTASHRLARQITNRINEHFGTGQEIAKAMTPSRIEVQAPAETWRNREDHFYELVMHLPLTREEQYLAVRARELVGMLRQPDAPAEDIALVLEAMGQPAVPVVQGFYTDTHRAVRYYAARVGIRLRDDTAVDVLGREAADRGSPFREAAVAELSNAPDVALARLPLRDLINDPNLKIRILAYEGLSRHNDEKIRRYKVGRDSFVLDVVPSGGEPIVYATRALEGRIAVIGKDVACRPPFFYLHPSRVIALSCDGKEPDVTMVRRTPFGQVSEPMKTPLELGEMIRFMGDSAEIDEETGKIKGLELSYSQVLQTIQALCQTRAVAARLEIQSATLSDSLGAIKPVNRPESEIPR